MSFSRSVWADDNDKQMKVNSLYSLACASVAADGGKSVMKNSLPLDKINCREIEDSKTHEFACEINGQQFYGRKDFSGQSGEDKKAAQVQHLICASLPGSNADAKKEKLKVAQALVDDDSFAKKMDCEDGNVTGGSAKMYLCSLDTKNGKVDSKMECMGNSFSFCRIPEEPTVYQKSNKAAATVAKTQGFTR